MQGEHNIALSDHYHVCFVIHLRANYDRKHGHTTIKYRSYKNFDEKSFLADPGWPEQAPPHKGNEQVKSILHNTPINMPVEVAPFLVDEIIFFHTISKMMFDVLRGLNLPV